MLVTATDGNHGRAGARMAALLGGDARIHVPRGLAATTLAVIAAEGAEVVQTGLNYDAAVCHADVLVGRGRGADQPGQVRGGQVPAGRRRTPRRPTAHAAG